MLPSFALKENKCAFVLFDPLIKNYVCWKEIIVCVCVFVCDSVLEKKKCV